MWILKVPLEQHAISLIRLLCLMPVAALCLLCRISKQIFAVNSRHRIKYRFKYSVHLSTACERLLYYFSILEQLLSLFTAHRHWRLGSETETPVFPVIIIIIITARKRGCGSNGVDHFVTSPLREVLRCVAVRKKLIRYKCLFWVPHLFSMDCNCFWRQDCSSTRSKFRYLGLWNLSVRIYEY